MISSGKKVTVVKIYPGADGPAYKTFEGTLEYTYNGDMNEEVQLRDRAGKFNIIPAPIFYVKER